MLNNLCWNWITLRKFRIAQTCLHDTLEPIRWRYKFCCEAEKWWVFWTVQQQHCYLWKNSAKWTALTLGKISTKLMRSGAIWRYLWIKKFATWRKIPEPGNTLKDEALFTAKFQNKSTQPYDATNENLVLTCFSELISSRIKSFILANLVQNLLNRCLRANTTDVKLLARQSNL